MKRDGDGDPMELAQKRLAAISAERRLLAVGPVGIRVGFLAGKMTLRAAVLPILGARLGDTAVVEAGEGAVRTVTVKGRALEAAMNAAKVPDGCWLALILGGSRAQPGHGALALLPCHGEAGR